MSNRSDLYTVINPYDQSVVHEYAYTKLDECFKAIESLTKFKKCQESIEPYARYEVLLRLKSLLANKREQMAELITLETGKVITESLGEVDRALVTVEIAAEEAKRINGQAVAANSFGAKTDKVSMTMKCPLGLILCITPFNFPLNLALHKIAPAYAAGNVILYKPSEHNYLSGKLLHELCLRAGMEDRSIKFIVPSSQDMSSICSHSSINCISFTGGSKTANKIVKSAGTIKLLFELGGNDALIVMDDAELSLAAKLAVRGRFSCAGQKCTSNKRVLVHSKVYDKFRELVLKYTKEVITGDPLDPLTELGPVVSIENAYKIKELLVDACNEGAQILCGGQIKGAMVSPCVIENVAPTSELLTEETFGPVLPLIRFSTLEQAIEIVNSNQYGLQAGVLTNNISVAKKLFNQLDVGTLIVNDGPGFRQEHLAFGGVKSSGIGREGIRYAIEEMSSIKQFIF